MMGWHIYNIGLFYFEHGCTPNSLISAVLFENAETI